jgi:hypothetical protein
VIITAGINARTTTPPIASAISPIKYNNPYEPLNSAEGNLEIFMMNLMNEHIANKIKKFYRWTFLGFPLNLFMAW